MSTYYKIVDNKLAWCYAEGHYTFDETYNNYKAALNDERSKEGINVIIDVRASEETRSYGEMEKIAILFKSSPAFKGKCAMLVRHDDDRARYGIARMMSSLAEIRDMNFEIFEDEQKAIKWLND